MADDVRVHVFAEMKAHCENLGRLGRATAFGATHTVGDVAQLATVVHSATDGYGADVALELSGAATAAEEALARLRLGGRCVWVGTVLPTPPVPVAPETVVRRHVTMHGVHNYQPRDLRDALTFLAGHHRTFPFGDMAGESVALAESGRAFRLAEESRAVRVACDKRRLNHC